MPFREKSRNALNRERFLALYDRLSNALGPSHWWPAETPFEVCIGAILTQNAPWSGVKKAIENLKRASLFDVGSIANADALVLAIELRPAIYANQKARRLKGFCGFLLDEYGGRIENMGELGIPEARSRLLALDGIGFETADSILLYALGKPVFVVDAYTKRICVRHGLVEERCGYEKLRGAFERVLDPDPAFFNEFHALLCRLGAYRCRRKPRCGGCPACEVLGDTVP
jgi:endonuclease III related protein